MKCKTKTIRERLEKEYGVRYSVLLELEYFDPIRMTIIDPMHNLFLGTAKRMLILWKDNKILLPEHFNQIQKRMEQVQCPPDVGKLPQKFASSFGSFNADQYIIQSLVVKQQGYIRQDRINLTLLVMDYTCTLCRKAFSYEFTRRKRNVLTVRSILKLPFKGAYICGKITETNC